MSETREQMAARLEDYADAWANEGMPDTVTALRAGAAALRAQGEDDAEWWRQVAQGLSVEIAKLQSERPRCEWRPFPGGPQCFRHAGHGLPHQTRSDESEASMTCACGAPTNLGSGDGEFRCWKCHCAWLSSQESVGSCSIVPSSSPGSGCEGQQGTGGSGSSEVSWREAVEAGEIPQACGQCECCAAWRTATETKRVAVQVLRELVKMYGPSTGYVWKARALWARAEAALRAEGEGGNDAA